jgi:chitinase
MMAFLPVFLSAQPRLVGYWQNYVSGVTPNFALDATDDRYGVVNVAFAVPKQGTLYDMEFVPCCGYTQAQFIAQIQVLQAAGKIVNVSIGGATDPVEIETAAERDIFVSSMSTILNTYGFDGIDIDLEGSSISVSSSSSIANPTDAKIINLVDAFETILADYQATNGKKMFLSTAPETAFVQGGMSNWGGIWGAYLPLLDALRTEWDLVHVQLYNSGSMFGIDGEIYSQGTADFVVSQTEAMIEGFTAVGNGGFFAGLPEGVVSVGLPACPSAAGGGFTPTATVTAAIEYLLGTGPKPGSYTLAGGPYPNLGGLMTWSVNWDSSASCNATSYEFATNYVTNFGESSGCFSPQLGPNQSACVSDFPLLLDSNTPTNTGVTFTWTDVSTGVTLITNSSTANTLSVSDPGVYRVSRDSMGCVRTDEVGVTNTLATPVLSGDDQLCASLPGTLMLDNPNDFPAGAGYQWSFDGSPLAGETSMSLANVREAGLASLVVSGGSCNSSGNLAVNSSLPRPVDGCAPVGQRAELAISDFGAGPFDWYDLPVGGTKFGSGTEFITPPLTETTTYYLEDVGSVGAATTGPAPGDLGAAQSSTSPTEMTFDIAVPLMLNSIDVIPLVYCFTHDVSAEVRNGSGTLMGSATLSVTDEDADCGTANSMLVTLDFGGISLPAATGYILRFTSDVKTWHYEGLSFPLDYSPYFTITRSDVSSQLPAVLNWSVNGGSCARLPVTATANNACMGTLPVDLLSFSARATGKNVTLNWEVINAFDFAGFRVERRTPNGYFGEIGYREYTAARTYDFIDEYAVSGQLNHYRLRLEDLDGTIRYADVVSAMPNGEPDFIVSPNPASDRIVVVAPEEANLQLLSITGQKLKTWRVTTGQGVFILPDVPAGTYFLRLEEAARTRVQKLLVR